MLYFDDMKINIALSSQNIIYALHHPDSLYMYIGQSMHGWKRALEHMRESALNRTKKEARSKWIRSLREHGREPQVALIEEVASPDDLDEAEIHAIAYMRSLGVPLLNHTDGGGGMRGYKYTKERMRKHIESLKCRAAGDPNYSDKMSEISLMYWTPERRAAKSAAMKGKGENISPEAREKQAAALRGKKKSPEHRAKIIESRKALWRDPVYRARQIAAQKKSHNTPEKKAQAAEWAKLASHETHRREDYRQRQSEMQKELAKSLERQQKRIDATTKLWGNDEYRDKVVAAITKGQRRRRARERDEG